MHCTLFIVYKIAPGTDGSCRTNLELIYKAHHIENHLNGTKLIRAIESTMQHAGLRKRIVDS